MSRKPETQLQKRIVKALRDNFPGCFFRKIHVSQFQSAGYPDLSGSVDGYAFYFEVKNPGENPSAIQVEVMTLMRQSGAVACVVRSPEEAVRIVQHTLSIRGRLGRAARSWIMSFIAKYR